MNTHNRATHVRCSLQANIGIILYFLRYKHIQECAQRVAISKVHHDCERILLGIELHGLLREKLSDSQGNGEFDDSKLVETL